MSHAVQTTLEQVFSSNGDVASKATNANASRTPNIFKKKRSIFKKSSASRKPGIFGKPKPEVNEASASHPAAEPEREPSADIEWTARDIAVGLVEGMFDGDENDAKVAEYPRVYAEVYDELTASRPAKSQASDTTTEVVTETAPRKTRFVRAHSPEAERMIHTLVRSIAKSGHGGEANQANRYLARKTDGFVLRAYAKAKETGHASIVLDMLAYECHKITQYGSWAELPEGWKRVFR